MVFVGILIIILFSCNVPAQKQDQSYSFSYSSNINTVYKMEENARSSAPIWTGEPEWVAYSLKTPSASKIADDVSIDPVTGIVTVQKTAEAAHEVWTVIASGDDSIYNAEIEIFINPRKLESFTLAYEPDIVEINRYVNIPEITPTLSERPEGIQLLFLIEPELPDELVYNQSSGIISGTLTAEGMQPTVYTITVRTTGNYQGTAKANLQLTFNNKPSWVDSVEYDVSGINIDLNAERVVNNVNIAAPHLEIKTGRVNRTAVFSTKDNRINITREGAIVIAQGADLSENDGKSVTFIILIDEETGVYAQEFTTLKVNIRKVDDIVFNTAPTPTYGDTDVSVGVTVSAVNGASEAVNYSSSDESIATVDPNGDLTIKAAGEVTITATSDYDPTITKTQTITIAKKDISNTGFLINKSGTTVVALVGGEYSAAITSDALVGGNDYTLSISPNTKGNVRIDNTGKITIDNSIMISDPRDYSITAFGQGNYTGTATGTFTLTVNRKPLLKDDLGAITNAQSDFKITTGGGSVITKTLTFNGNASIGTDYSIGISPPEGVSNSHVTIDDNTGKLTISADIIPGDAGIYTVTATGKDNYVGTAAVSFELKVAAAPVSIVYSDAPLIASYGIAIGEMSPTVTPSDAADNVSYSISPDLEADTGLIFDEDTGKIHGTATSILSTNDYTVSIAGKDGTKYDGSSKTTTISVTVNPKSLADVSGFSVSAANHSTTVQTGSSHSATVNNGGLTPGSDYDLSITGSGVTSGTVSIDNSGSISITNAIALTHAGTYTVKASGKGSYTGELTDTFTLTVDKIPLAANDFSFQNTLTATALTAEVISDVVTSSLTAATDYSLAITNWPGNANAVGIDNDGTISIDAGITVSDAGDYTITATGQGNYTGELTDTFTLTVDKIPLAANDFSFQNTLTATALTAEVISGVVTSSLTTDTDYSLAITNWPGNANAVGIDNDGTISIDAGITVSDAGDYTITATGQGNYTGELTDTFTLTVDKIPLAANGFSFQNTLTATALTAEVISDIVTSSLTAATDYSLAITNWPGNVNAVSIDNDGTISIDAGITVSDAGDYTITATGQGNYTGEVEGTFNLTVDKVPLAANDVSFQNTLTATALTAEVISGVVTSSLTAATDYSLAITNWPGNANAVSIVNDGTISIDAGITVSDAGDYTITATGQGNYTGEVEGTFNLTVDKVTLAANDFSFQNTLTATALTAEVISDIVTSSLTAATDYSLAITNWPGNANAVSIDNDGTISIDAGITVSDAGDYTITATGQGNYSGTVTGTFSLTVNPKELTSALLGVINNPSADFEVSAGITSNHIRTLSFDGTLSIGTDYSLVIKTRPQGATVSHVSLNSTTGVLIVTTDVVPDDAGVYTVEASGQGNYTDPVNPVTATFTLTVTELDIISVTYNPVTAVYDTVMAAAAGPTVDPSDAAATYSIDPNLNADTGLDFNTATGEISGTATSILSPKDYTVTIAGKDGTKYDGSSKTTTVSVTVNPKSLTDVSGFSVSAAAHSTTVQTGGSHSATVNNGGLTPGSDYDLSITGSGVTDAAVSIDNSGSISITNAIALTHAGIYTVKASGKGSYTGELTDTFTLTVDKIPLAANDFSFQNTLTATAFTAEVITDIVTSSLTVDTDYSLAITNWPGNANAVGIDNDGTISIDAGITVSDAGDYTITATGQGNYSGTVTGTLQPDGQSQRTDLCPVGRDRQSIR